MSMSADRPVPFEQAYTREMRMAHIRKHIETSLANGRLVRCGHTANTYGGGIINKSDVQAELAKFSELGGSAK